MPYPMDSSKPYPVNRTKQKETIFFKSRNRSYYFV